MALFYTIQIRKIYSYVQRFFIIGYKYGIAELILRTIRKIKSGIRRIFFQTKTHLLIDKDIQESASILFVSHDASRTGAPIFLLDFIKLIKSKLDIRCVILLARNGELNAEFRKIAKTYCFEGDKSNHDEIISHLKRENIKLIYANTITNGDLLTQLNHLNCMICCHVHELAHSIETYFDTWNIKKVLETTQLFLAGSKKVANYLEQTMCIPKPNIKLAYPFVDMEKFNNVIKDNNFRLTLPPNAIVVGACATFTWRKSPDLFLQVARTVIKKINTPVVFVWVGGPFSNSDFKNLQHDKKSCGLSDTQIMFIDTVENHLPYLAMFDIFLLPSREDPFPLVVLDAAAMEIPIVCFDNAGGAPEFVEEDAGIIVPYLDVEHMAVKICDLINDECLRNKLGKRGKQKILERHQKAVGGDHLVNHVQQMLAGIL